MYEDCGMMGQQTTNNLGLISEVNRKYLYSTHNFLLPPNFEQFRNILRAPVVNILYSADLL